MGRLRKRFVVTLALLLLCVAGSRSNAGHEYSDAIGTRANGQPGELKDLHSLSPLNAHNRGEVPAVLQVEDTAELSKFTEQAVALENLFSKRNAETTIPGALYSTTSLHHTSQEQDTAMRSLFSAFLMIMVSEVGDKTFLIAAIMAMSHSRALVFSAALSALAVMSVLSAVLGNILPLLISKIYTQYLAGVIFLVFGFRMWREAGRMSKSARAEDELVEVAAEIRAMEKKDDIEIGVIDVENGLLSKKDKRPSLRFRLLESLQKIASYPFSPVFIEIFVLTFLAEWGDRSQIATIVMGAAGHMQSVVLGTVFGHVVCTGIAVLSGRMLAARISVRTMTMVGATAFTFFGVLTMLPLVQVDAGI